jgi:hypothetical protein
MLYKSQYREALADLRRQAVALASAQSAITKCCEALGDRTTNEILSRVGSVAREVQDKIEIAERRYR